jgi:hypothetical protein
MGQGQGPGVTETAFVLGSMTVAYGLGAGAVVSTLGLAGWPVAPRGAVWLVLLAPPIAAMLAEATTGKWAHTPGTLGLGSLWVVFPLLCAGLASGALAATARHLLPRRPARAPAAWAGVALVCSLVALGLWQYWPAPQARLW